MESETRPASHALPELDRTEVAQMETSPNLFAADLVHLDGNAVVALRGELDMDAAPDLARVLNALVNDGPAEVVLECSGLSFIDSSGLAVLVSAQRDLDAQHRRLVVRSPRRNVVRVFEITELMEFLHVSNDEVVVDPTPQPTEDRSSR
jgi:anti-sigma B factor antagonist